MKRGSSMKAIVEMAKKPVRASMRAMGWGKHGGKQKKSATDSKPKKKKGKASARVAQSSE